MQAIVVAAPTGRILDLRTKLDEWAAFSTGGELLTKGGKQRWFNYPCPWTSHERLRTYMDQRSVAADHILSRGANRDAEVKKRPTKIENPHRLIVDHAIPIKVLHDIIVSDTSLCDLSSLEDFLRVCFKRGVITKVEDGLLNKAGLKQSMPRDWQHLRDSPYARYEQAQIEMLTS